MSLEAMNAVIAYGYASQARKPLPELNYETLLKGIDEHKEYVRQWNDKVVNDLYRDWHEMNQDDNKADWVVIPYIGIANGCHAVLLASVKAYVNRIMQTNEQINEFAYKMGSHDGVICAYLSALKGHSDIVATLVQMNFWNESRSKFRESDMPWWLNDYIINHAKELKLIAD